MDTSVPPSSPPQFTADTPSPEPGLPPLPTRTRPSRFNTFDSVASSDPAFFSSDDGPDASLEDYHNRKQKRKFRGSWWDRKEERSAKRGSTAAKFDSGVWLESDSSQDSLDGLPDRPEDPFSSEEAGDVLPTSSFRSAVAHGTPHKALTPEESAARRRIEKCLDEGGETIDLSGFDLESIEEETIKPLHLIIKQTRVKDEVPSSDHYQSLTPDVKLFLFNNKLSRLPLELFNLQHLTVLSLRNNNLTELPSSISDLTNLIELNVSVNRLRWLPWELLKLIGRKERHLRRLYAKPNPLLRPASIPSQDDGPASPSKSRQSLVRPYSTKTYYFDVDGALPPGSDLNPSALPEGSEITVIKDQQDWPHTREEFREWLIRAAAEPPKVSAGRTPSLLELATRTCMAYLSVAQLSEYGGESLPARALKEAKEVEEQGPRRCSGCRKNFIIPRAEQIEFWETGSDGILPFLRRMCSAECDGSSSYYVPPLEC